MNFWIGTSGYNYPEWKGSFYPEKLPSAKMLPYYAERFPTVEINYTFYRSPNEKILDGWNKATPEHFKLTLKAPRRITHDRRLRDSGDLVRQFFETAATLGPKLGALLFQLPPNFKKDAALLDAFLDAFPPRVSAAFEFRHDSWLDEEIYARLRARQTADIGSRADRDNAIARDRQCSGGGFCRIHRVNRSVDDNEVRSERGLLGARGRRHGDQQGYGQGAQFH